MNDPILPTLPLPTPPYPPAVPMTFGQILDRIFRLLKTSWRPYIGIGIFTIGPFLLFYAAIFGTLYLAGFFQQPNPHPNVSILLFATLPLGLLFLPLMFLLYGLYYGASTYAALQADHGQPTTAVQSIRHAWSRIGRYTWLMFLRSLIVAAPFIVCAAAVGVGTLLFGLTSKGNPNPGLLFLLIPLAVLLYLGGIVYAILMSLRLALAFPACVNENITAMQAIKRSGVLTQGAKGRIFLVALVIWAISYAGIMVLYVIFAFSGAIVAFAGAGHWQRLGPAGYILLGILGMFVLAFLLIYAGLLMAAYSFALAVQYRDQCLRKDLPSPPASSWTQLPPQEDRGA